MRKYMGGNILEQIIGENYNSNIELEVTSPPPFSVGLPWELPCETLVASWFLKHYAVNMKPFFEIIGFTHQIPRF